MANHTPMQSYRQNYCKLCMTGLLGCRWHRYKQSTLHFTKADVFWLLFLMITACFVTCWFYFWLIAENDQDDFHWFLYNELEVWYSWHAVLLGVTTAVFIYCALLLLLTVCHVIIGHQVFIHMGHRIMLCVILIGCVATIIVIWYMWPQEFAALSIAFQMHGPFIHIGLVIFLTALLWVFIEQWHKIRRVYIKILCVVLYIGIMIPVYVMPFVLHSPCVTQNLPPRPQLFAHRGSSAIAPENTLASFEDSIRYADGIESDVRISWDGVPFMFHDLTLKRTSNVAKIFPSFQNMRPELFNMSDLQKLDVGSWFLDSDPFGTVGSLPESRRSILRQQTIPTLEQVLSLINGTDIKFLVDLIGPPTGHPYESNFSKKCFGIFINSSLPQDHFYIQDYISKFTDMNFTFTLRGKVDLSRLERLHIHSINAWFTELSKDDILLYLNHNISVNIYTVNTRWMFSYYWCLGVTSVASDKSHMLSRDTSPLWIMTPTVYKTVWIIIDILSVLAIISTFTYPQVRLQKTHEPAELTIQALGRSRGEPKDPQLLDSSKDTDMEDMETTEIGHHNSAHDNYESCQ